ncbi:hypothetical protein [Pseudomonas sp. ANT_J28]|uniref:hypothetical protein n=1 Tax=Pseudomonas sp. ANT_J28 TaxID=2597352 RepID=UPI0011F2D57F|nr:hypothetical protein [Pseudomonas sp. ANT_J28]KAA0983271.1 hypothetical protein FQ187_12710 [Pseudomonas sp. ANT_J28]
MSAYRSSRNKIIADAIGISPDEVSLYVVEIEKQSSGEGFNLYFAVQTPEPVRLKAKGLDARLILETGPLDIDGL